jgi:hypothetical protein
MPLTAAISRTCASPSCFDDRPVEELAVRVQRPEIGVLLYCASVMPCTGRGADIVGTRAAPGREAHRREPARTSQRFGLHEHQAADAEIERAADGLAASPYRCRSSAP